jgi:sulfur relay (sulfurtransferase) complex TusBCD TusD component (DsrE family)
MTHALLIASHPDSDTHRHAQAFCDALTQKTAVSVVYFVGDAVEVTQAQHSDTLENWLKIRRNHGVLVWACSGSMSSLPACDLPPDIEIAGHASWVEASLKADKILSFPA